MYLYIIYTIYGLHMLRHSIRYTAWIHFIHFQAHGKQGICILSKGLPVHKVSVPPDDLSQDQSGHCRIDKFQKVIILSFTVHDGCNNRRNHTTVNSQTAAAYVKNLHEIIFITVPAEDHIVGSGSDESKQNSPQSKISIDIRILARPFSIPPGHHDT